MRLDQQKRHRDPHIRRRPSRPSDGEGEKRRAGTHLVLGLSPGQRHRRWGHHAFAPGRAPMSPGILLGVLLALIGAQLTRLVWPRRLGYVAALALAVAGVVAGELVALELHGGGPPLGPLHPLAAAAGIAALEVVGGPARK